MSGQLEVVKFRDLVPVKAIPRLIPGLGVTTAEVVGEDFSSVEEVRINEALAPEFMIINDKTLWVQLPSGVKTIQTIEVLSSKFTKTAAASKVTFKIGNTTRRTTGILKLTQLFTKWLLQSPGSDIRNPDRGGGLQGISGSILGSKNMQPVLAAVTRAVDNTTKQIRIAQANIFSLPLDERLLRASLLGMNVQEDKMEASIQLRLSSMAGQEAVSNLIL